MIRRSRLASLLILFTALGCSGIFSPNDGERTKLDANRQLWSSQALHTYTFTLQQDCFCVINGPVRVYVANDTVAAAVQVSTGQSIDRQFVQTITSLFDFIGRGLDAHAAVLRVTYDQARGYPSTIVYDGSLMVADDEVTFTVSNVVAGAAPAGSAMTSADHGTAPAAPARLGSAPAVTRPLSIRTAAP